MSTYRVLVTGSRDLNEPLLVREQLGGCLETAASLGRLLVVVHGHCPDGPDSFADDWAHEMKHHGFAVDFERHPPQNHPTQNFGPWPRCGPIRNSYMVSLGADECLAFIGPCTSPRCQRKMLHGSHGASDCASKADRAGIGVRRWDLWRTS
jgi:hypothetical protein